MTAATTQNYLLLVPEASTSNRVASVLPECTVVVVHLFSRYLTLLYFYAVVGERLGQKRGFCLPSHVLGCGVCHLA